MPNTDAQRKATIRAAQDEDAMESERGVNRVQMATSRAAQDKEARYADRAADSARKSTRKQKSKVDRNDGLRCNEVLAGTMLVPDLSNSDDAIGKMDHVCQFCCAMKFRLETPNLCCNSGHIVVDPFP